MMAAGRRDQLKAGQHRRGSPQRAVLLWPENLERGHEQAIGIAPLEATDSPLMHDGLEPSVITPAYGLIHKFIKEFYFLPLEGLSIPGILREPVVNGDAARSERLYRPC